MYDDDPGLGLRYRTCLERGRAVLRRNWFVIGLFAASVGYLVYGAVDAHNFCVVMGKRQCGLY